MKEDKGDVVEIALDIGREMEVRWRSLEKEGTAKTTGNTENLLFCEENTGMEGRNMLAFLTEKLLLSGCVSRLVKQTEDVNLNT